MFAQTNPAPLNAIGPYSAWPRRRMSIRAKAASAAAFVGVAVFAHCVAPML